MARGGHALPKVSLGPAMPDLSTPCGRITPDTALWRIARPQGGWFAAVFYPFRHPTPYAYDHCPELASSPQTFVSTIFS